MTPISIDKIELLALKQLAVICGALANSLTDESAARTQRLLTSVLVNVIRRAEIERLDREEGGG